MKYIVIGAGVSGLSVARMLSEAGCEIVVYEKEDKPGGLIRCDRVEGALYHRVGGHVFNSKSQEVLAWFWSHVSQSEFHKTERNAAIAMPDSTCVGYPIENHLYQLPESTCAAVIDDLLNIFSKQTDEPRRNFDEFLRGRFGQTLYDLYFAPYNRKIWRCALTDVPLEWLDGKLPMPTVREILLANIGQVQEQNMVHSSFWYPLRGGSQYIADSLARGLNIRYNLPARSISRTQNGWCVNEEEADGIIFCGNVKSLPTLLRGSDTDFSGVDSLEAHGTTSVLCRISPNPYSWIYLPDKAHEAHRIIMTGNFAESNNPPNTTTAVIEFSAKLSAEEIRHQLACISYNPQYISHTYTPYTYPLQQYNTRHIIRSLKNRLEPQRFYLLGRFAEWEYYNMDAAIESSMKLCTRLFR